MRRAASRAVVLATGLFAAAAPAAERPWIEVKSAHFSVLTNASDGSGRDVAWQFEQMRAALQKLWPWAKLSPGKPVVVLAARDEATLKALAPEYWEKGAIAIVSVSVEGRDRHYLALQIDSQPREDVKVNPYFNAYRAYVHVALAASFERPLPLWLKRGMAELLGNLRVRDKDIFLGRVIPWHLELVRQRSMLPLATLLGDSVYPRDEDKRRHFDAQAWAFLHYLIFGEGGTRTAQLNRYATMLLQGAKPDVALRESFSDLASLERGLYKHVSRLTIEYSRIDVDVSLDREKLPARSVPAAEAAALRAAFHVAMGHPAEAMALVQQAKAADPKAPGPFDVEGLLADSEDAAAKALAAYAKAAEMGSTSFYTFYRDAQLRSGAADAATHERMERSLTRSVELNPEYASGHSFLAEMKIQLGRPQEALEPARRAVSLEPGAAYNHVALASALFSNGKRDEAIAEIQVGLGLAQNDRDRAFARRTLEHIQRAESAAEESAAAASFSACGQGDAAACARILPELAKQCDAGEAQACNGLAWTYEKGAGAEPDRGKVAVFTGKACAAGDKSACVRVAWHDARGDGVAKNEAKALAALEALCSDGVLEGCKVLGIIHAGKPTKASLTKARAFLKKGCDGGEQSACSLLASMPK